MDGVPGQALVRHIGGHQGKLAAQRIAAARQLRELATRLAAKRRMLDCNVQQLSSPTHPGLPRETRDLTRTQRCANRKYM